MPQYHATYNDFEDANSWQGTTFDHDSPQAAAVWLQQITQSTRIIIIPCDTPDVTYEEFQF